MPRKPRFYLPGVPQHVIQRGNNRAPCFFAEEDYRRYIDDLQKTAEKHNCRVHAYILMTNHVAAPVHPCARGTCSSMNIAFVGYADG